MNKHLQKVRMMTMLLIMALFSSWAVAQTNLAPSAVATGGPACNTGACSTLNDLNFGTCGTQQTWLTSAATNPGSTVHITFTWTSMKIIEKITIHAGQAGARYLTGGTVQIFNGTTWVNHQPFTQPNTSLCSYDINFPTVACTAVRIIDMTVGGTQTSNVNFREVEIWQGSLSNDDIGVAAIDTPGLFCGGPQNIVARIQNFGVNQVTGFNVHWELGGVAQTTIPSTAFLDTIGGASPNFTRITLATGVTFPSGVLTSIKAWTSAPNANTDTIGANDTIFVLKTPSISGTYTINPAGTGTSNFTSFNAAINAMLAGGICGPMHFTVAAGTYNNQVIIPNIPGASHINTITFDGVNPDSCIITGSYATQATVILNAARYVIFKNFRVVNTAAGNSAGIAAVGTYNRITLFNNRVFVPIQVGTSAQGFGILGTGTANGGGASAHGGDSLLLDSNVVTGGGYGIYVLGSAINTANRGMQFLNNKIVSANYMGAYINAIRNPINVINNDIHVLGENYGYYALWFGVNSHDNTTVGHRIIGNNVRNWSYCGIYVTTHVLSSTAAATKIYNNVSEGRASGYTPGQYGIYLTNPANAVAEIYHNTVVMNSSSTSTIASCLYNTGSANILVKNNIFYYAGGSGAPVYSATAVTGNKINYNIYYNGANPTTGNAIYNSGAYWNRTNFNTNARGGDSSFFTNPSFLNRLPTPGNLALADGCDGYGVNLSADVPTDITGTPRATLPNIGAYEFAGGVANNLRVVGLLTPFIPVTAGTQDLRFLVKNIGNNSVTSYNAAYRQGTSTPVSIAVSTSMGICATDTATFTGLNQVTIGPVNHLTMFTDGPNASPDANPSNDTLRVSLFTPLNGTYTVGGTTPDFPTVAAAAAGLQFGVSGPVTFDIRPGTYTGQVVVNGPILGASDSTRITFEGNSSLNRIITNGSVGPVFLINQASFVTVQNLKVINTAPTGQFSGIGVVGSNANSNASKVWIRKNVVEVPVLSGTASNGYGIIFTGTVGATGVAAMRADSCIIDSNSITGGGYGLVFYGATNALYNRGLVFRGNQVIKANYMGGYILYNNNPIDFIGNEINVQGQNYGYYGLYYLNNSSTHPTIPTRFNNNKVTGFSYYGAYVTLPVSISTAAPMEFYNNMFNSQPDGYTVTQQSVYLTLGANTIAKIYHNTSVVNTGNTSTTSSAFWMSGSTNAEVKNNIFAYYGGAGVPFYTATAITGNKVNYNNYFNSNTSGNLVYNSGANWNASNYLTNARGGDTSYNYAPIFVGRLPMPGNLRLTSACAQRGFDLTADVPTDVDNQIRNVPPQLGADENASGAIDMAMDFIHSPSFPIDSGWQDVVVRVRNNGSTTITSMDVSYKMNSAAAVTQGWTGSLAPCDTALVTFSGIQQLYVPFNVGNTLKVYTSNPNAGVDGNNLNDTMIVDVATPLNGNYTIGNVAGDYPSFNAAINALTIRGVGGPVTFNVRTGTYTESVFLNGITGANASRSITFKSMANNRDSVTLAHNSVAGNQFVVGFGPNASYISFKDMTIRQLYNNGTASPNIVRFNGNASYDSLINCNVLHPYVSFSTTGYGYTVFGQNLTGIGNGFKNNLFRGSYYGFYFMGPSTIVKVRNTYFEGNTFDSAYYSSLYYIYYHDFLTFKNNNVNMVNLGNGTSYSYLYYLDSTTTFTGNKFNYTIPCYVYQYYFRHNGVSPRSLIANNTFVGPAFYHGFGNTIQNLDFFNNSYSTGSQYFYIANSGFTGVKFRNNIFMSATPTSIYWSAVPVSPGVNTDYNNFWSTASTTAIYATANQNLTTFRLANPTQERNSVQANPGFMSATNVMPNPASADVWNTNGRGEIQAEVPADMNNVARPATIADGVPDLGAYEVTPTSTPNNVTITPATPVAGGTQVMLSGLDTVMTIAWDPFSTIVPSSISAKLYTGVKAPLLGTATGYTNFYLDVNAPAGVYNYTAKLYYNPSWLGTVPAESVLKMSVKTPTAAWLNLLSSSSLVDSNLKSLVSTTPLYDMPAIFTGTDDNNPLPVEMIKFTGSKVDQAASLAWATATEKNSSHFEVERSFDATNFKAVGKVKSNGNSASVKNYNFTDEDAFVNNEPVVYYRLKMVDRDGSFEYSNTISINNNDEEITLADVKVFPNPFNNDLYIDYKAASNETVALRDMSGRVIFTQSLNSADMVHQLNIPNSLDKGIYILTFSSNSAKSVKVIRN